MSLHFKLNSGRVLLLKEPLTPEEEAEFRTPTGMIALEHLADIIQERATTALTEGDPRYEELKKQHSL